MAEKNLIDEFWDAVNETPISEEQVVDIKEAHEKLEEYANALDEHASKIINREDEDKVLENSIKFFNAVTTKEHILNSHFNLHGYKRATLMLYYIENFGEECVINFGLSVCSKHDQFVKKFGNKQAKERAEKSPYKTIYMDGIYNKEELLHLLYLEVVVIQKYPKKYVDKQAVRILMANDKKKESEENGTK
ncbi:TPA: hypothetical protein HA253_03050 [Candidatus Woesearchaeota archaeon]|nr:hypothetical protein [Candidatus Woesearchaeota archaeon]